MAVPQQLSGPAHADVSLTGEKTDLSAKQSKPCPVPATQPLLLVYESKIQDAISDGRNEPAALFIISSVPVSIQHENSGNMPIRASKFLCRLVKCLSKDN